MDISSRLIEACVNPVPNIETIKKYATPDLRSILDAYDTPQFRHMRAYAAKNYVLQHDIVRCYLFMKSEGVTYESLTNKPSLARVFVYLQKEFKDDHKAVLKYMMRALKKPEAVLQNLRNIKVQLLDKD